MGLGLMLTAEPATGPERPLLDHLDAWARRRLGDDASITRGDAGLSLTLHPTAESVDFSLNESGRLVVSAKTSTTGPGYHAYLVELLAEVAQALGLVWSPVDDDGQPGDETGYFPSRNYADLEHEMLMWLRAMGSSMTSHDGTDFDVCLSLGYRYEVAAHTRTPLGPRDLDYWKRVLEDPRQGIDFFAWWERGQGPGYQLGLALALMWTDVRWREPYTEGERKVLQRVATSLQRAYESDPTREYPWREWAEVSQFLGEDGPLQADVRGRAATVVGPLIGYRRHRVEVPLVGGWSIRIPGEFAEEWDNEGTFHGWAADKGIWFSAFRHGGADPMTVEALRQRSKKGVEGFERREGGLAGYATLARAEEGGEQYWQLSSETAVGSKLAVLTVCLGDETDRPWALDTWRTLRQPQRAED